MQRLVQLRAAGTEQHRLLVSVNAAGRPEDR